ncbi:hypothetical protein [Acaryochloris sp. IP29b_bin.148]|uniref:hypothetical protein n=1 Tax=Acaryochloris sp. IP29b_bin.148 TaxID=2969218 RepID=UPI0026075F29|nr:hypothetical protein [Acaryochloris sp. IP29b_bin.148]
MSGKVGVGCCDCEGKSCDRTPSVQRQLGVNRTVVRQQHCPQHQSAIDEKEQLHQPLKPKVLFQQPLMLAVPERHPFAQRSSVRLADLDGQRFIDRVNCEFFPRNVRCWMQRIFTHKWCIAPAMRNE